MPPPNPLGMIGLGLMGSALSERFLGAGLPVLGYDVAADRRAALEALGGRATDSAADVAAACDLVLLSLPTTDVVESALGEMSGHFRPGATIIDTTTGEPEQTAAVGKRLADRGVQYLDATVSGSSAQVRTAQVVVMAGGDPAAFARCEPLFGHFAREWFHVGPWGSGAKMKLAANLVLGLNRAALAEGLAFAARLGLDPRRALEILRAGAAYSRIMDSKGRKMVEGDFAPEARLSQHLKDVRLILSAGERAGARLPLSSLHERLLAELEAAGYGGSDNSAILKAFEGGAREAD